MSYVVTENIIDITQKIKDKPYLYEEFKKFGWSKLRVVVGIARIDTDKFWAEKVRALSKKALEER